MYLWLTWRFNLHIKVTFRWYKIFILPSCDDTDDVHQESSCHHLWCLHTAGTKDNSIGGCGNWKHEGIAAGYSCCHGQVDGVGAEGLGHLGEDWDQDVGCGSVACHFCHHGGAHGYDETNQQWRQRLKFLCEIELNCYC